jgi:nucleoside-diphosphate-sugar epimerase
MLRIDRLHTLETTNGTILNLGTGVQTTLAEIVSTLESIAGAPLTAEWNTMPARPWDTETWVADTTRLRQALGWVPTVSVREGLALSVEWFRANRRFYPAQA